MTPDPTIQASFDATDDALTFSDRDDEQGPIHADDEQEGDDDERS